MTLSQASLRFDRIQASIASTLTPLTMYKQSAWVYGAVNMITSNIGRTPFRVYDSNDNVVETGPLPQLIRSPSRYQQQNTDRKYREAYMTNVLLAGAVLRCFTEMEGHRPTQTIVQPRNWFFAEDAIDENGIRVPLKWHLGASGGMRTYLDGDECYHDALYNPFHDFEGLAPLNAAILSAGNSISVSEFVDRYFQNDATSGLVMTTDNELFDNKMAKEAQKRWNEECGGKENAFGVKFVGMGLTPHPLGGVLDAAAQKVIASMSKEQIVTGVFRIPMDVFGSGDKGSTGVTIGAQTMQPAREMFLLNVVIPWADWYDTEFNKDVTWRFNVTLKARHDFSDNPVLETRRLERAKIAAQLIDRGVPLNEVIRWLRLEIEIQAHGDEFWTPNWTLPASVIQKHGEAVYKASAASSAPVGASGQAGDRARAEHVARIESMLQQASIKELAREDERSRLNGRKVPNADRIAQLMGDPK